MSGGVDSSTAAYLLKSEGHDVIGLSMQMYDNLASAESSYGGCCTIDDLADARRVAWKLDIPHFILNLEENFHEKVIMPFVQGYLTGTTPSPCVLCNTHVKFELFHRKAFAIGAEKIATGHYARITRGSDGSLELRKAKDLAKDQSYFLFELSQDQLRDAMFPLGELTKPQVRLLAEQGGLGVARKKESYEICFVPEKGGYAKVVEREAASLAGVAATVESRSRGDGRNAVSTLGSDGPPLRELAQAVAAHEAGGEIVDTDGNVVGRHDGYYHFTIGQRRGLQVGGSPDRTYVVDVNSFTRRVTIGPGSALEKSELVAERVHWIAGHPPPHPIEVQARVRSRMPDVAATVLPIGDGLARVVFAQTLRAMAPGQAVVFYQDDLCLGGGWIGR